MERITGRQLNLLGSMFMYPTALVFLPGTLMTVARQDAWLAVFLPLGVMLAVLWALSQVSARFPQMDLFMAMISRFPIAGRLLALGYVGFFFVILIRDLRTLMDFTNISLLPATPLVVLGALIVVSIVWVTRGGIEQVARVTELFAPSLIVVTLALPLLTLNGIQLRFLAPLLEWGPGPSLHASWIMGAWLGEVALLPLIFSGQRFRFRDGVYGMIGSVFFFEIVLVVELLLLGPYLGSRPLFTTWEAVRHIRLTDFLDRWDLVLVGIWFPSVVTKVSYGLYVVCHGLGRIAGSLDPRPLSSALGLFALVVSLWAFENTLEVVSLNHLWPWLGLLFEVAIPLLLFLVLRPAKARSAGQAASDA